MSILWFGDSEGMSDCKTAGVGKPVLSATASRPYAGFWHRLAAGLIDFLLLAPISLPFLWIAGFSRSIALVSGVLAGLCYAGYVVCCHGQWGKTFGKMVMRIDVIRLSGEPLGWGKSALRHSGELVFGLLAAVGCATAFAAISKESFESLGWLQQQMLVEEHLPAWIAYVELLASLWVASELVVLLFNKKRRSLHDFLAGSVVVRDGGRLRWLPLCLLLAALLAVPILLARDAALSPEARAWMAPRQPDIAKKDNAYFAVMGFNAPAADNPHRAGVESVQAFEDALVRDYDGVDTRFTDYDGYPPESPFSLTEDTEALLCRVEKGPCLETFATRSEPLREQLVRHEPLLSRYLNLYNYPEYRTASTADLKTPLPQLAPLFKAHRLLQAEIGVEAMTGDKDKALQALQRDIAYLRGWMAKADTLLVKLAAANLLFRDLHLYAQLLDAGDVGQPGLTALGDRIIPLSGEERSLSMAMRREFQGLARVYLSLERQGAVYHDFNLPPWSGLGLLLYKPHASINRGYLPYQKAAAQSEQPAFVFARHFSEEDGVRPGFEDYLYNHVGTVLNSIALPEFKTYIARMHDLDGLIRLVQLKRLIRVGGLTAEQIPGLLVQQREQYSNPYTGEPMLWDARRQVLYFEGPGEEEGRRELSLLF